MRRGCLAGYSAAGLENNNNNNHHHHQIIIVMIIIIIFCRQFCLRGRIFWNSPSARDALVRKYSKRMPTPLCSNVRLIPEAGA